MSKITNLIGNTPMIKIEYEIEGKIKSLYAKLEYYNLTGSIKDRIAYYIIKDAMEQKILKDGMPILEATSGNTGISLAALGSYYKHPVFIYMPDWMSIERRNLIKSFGANVILISKAEGGVAGGAIKAKKKAEELNGFVANQFENKSNFKAHYETTGKEILEQIPEKIYALVAGVGTGGTLMGAGMRIKEQINDIKLVAVEPENSPVISQGKVLGGHKIEGIGAGFLPDLVDKSLISQTETIKDDDALNMSRKLARELGLGVGISSGANIMGAILWQNKINKPVVTVFPDDNKKYLSTELMGEINKNEDLISNKVKLIGYEEV